MDRLVLENDDVVTAIEWMRAQPWVTHDDITVADCSFGGIEALFTAERPVPGLRAALDFAGASMSWDDSPLLRERLLRAVESARLLHDGLGPLGRRRARLPAQASLSKLRLPAVMETLQVPIVAVRRSNL